MIPLVSGIVMRGGGGPLTRFEVILFLLIAGTMLLVAICWGAVEDWDKRTRGRNWPTVSAVIDVVNVTFMQDNFPRYALDSSHYKATLTYAYRYPEQQMGDYSRSFGNEDDAKAWANSYKGETVTVHVDPRDPTRSVLREEDL
jgi:Protein of unknown function (DUF3592)